MTVQVNNNISAVQTLILENMERALKAVGFYVEGEAKKNIHSNQSIDTGMLLNSISSDVILDEKKINIGSDKNYAVFVEKGTGIYAVDGNGRQTPWSYPDPDTGEMIFTRGQHPAPFLAPAAEDNIDTIRNIIAANMARGMT